MMEIEIVVVRRAEAEGEGGLLIEVYLMLG